MSKGDGHAKSFSSHKGMGLVNQVFCEETLTKLSGNLGIGNNPLLFLLFSLLTQLAIF